MTQIIVNISSYIFKNCLPAAILTLVGAVFLNYYGVFDFRVLFLNSMVVMHYIFAKNQDPAKNNFNRKFVLKAISTQRKIIQPEYSEYNLHE
ncbi:hypothetical protein CXF72_11640 [Psychromonas sp. MB-3u-54]|nr:hypothetical protein CXF72_11640 [Psychromonas sp. MB-3u-54]